MYQGTIALTAGHLRRADLEAKRVVILSGEQSELRAASRRGLLHLWCREDRLDSVQKLRSFISIALADCSLSSAYFVHLQLRPLLVGSSILWVLRPGQTRSRFSFKLYVDRRDGGIRGEGEDDPSGHIVEVSEVPRVGFIELNADRHEDASDHSARKQGIS